MTKFIVRASTVMCMAAFTLAMAQAVDTTKAVKLGGVWVPADKFIVYLGFGHSNMIGRSGMAPVDTTTHPHCWNYKIQSNITPGWILAKPLLHAFGADGSGGGSGNGPWMPFLKNMIARYPDYYFGVIENPESGQGLACDYQPGLSEYEALVTNSAKLFVGKCTFGGALMMLGSTSCERDNATNARAFSANAVRMMAAVRTALQAPKMILMVNEWEACASGSYSPTSANATIIRGEIAKIPSLINYSFTINNQGIPCSDDHHFQNPGYVTFTGRAIDSMMKHGWFPDARAANTEHNFTAQNKKMELSFDLKNLKQNTMTISLPTAIKNPSVKVFDSKGGLLPGQGVVVGDKLRYDFPEGQSGCFIVRVTNNGQSYAKRFLMVR